MFISSRRVALRQYGASRSISVTRDCRRASRVTEVYTEPPSRGQNQPLRVYSNPFCPFAQVHVNWLFYSVSQSRDLFPLRECVWLLLLNEYLTKLCTYTWIASRPGSCILTRMVRCLCLTMMGKLSANHWFVLVSACNIWTHVHVCDCISDYLDEVFGETRLWPLDSFKKASQSILLSDFSNKV